MAAPKPSGLAALVRLRLAGVGFLVVIALLVGLTVALYQKTFTPVVDVTLQADRIGNQLSAPADVKLRGLVVGEVRGVSSTGDGAKVELALQPDKVRLIPRNVEARLLPKTLFGEKFVDLVLPDSPSEARLKQGDVIPQDRSKTAIETERVLNDFLPLLQSLKPAQLSMTLNALSAALRGRGDRLGNNFELVDAYFKELNPELPKIQENFRGLADVTNNYADAAPDLLRMLDNFSAVARNTVDQKQELATFLSSTATFADSADRFLTRNENRLVTLASASRPSLETYARYAPEFPCIAGGLTRFQPLVEKTFGGLQPGLHITLELTRDNGPYSNGEQPRFLDDRGPQCYGLPNKVQVPAPDTNFKDGYRDGQPGTTSTAGVSADPALYLSQPQVQRQMLDSVLAPVMDVPYDGVPDIAQLLFGPVARGTTVGLT
ncbi:MAG: MCE family protein [Actinobacteria bacterium]|nr:MCE family protein [Actinomycetota bacterium]MCA1722200.1 MCE family protein [Actinomycetota bacterium]